MRVDIVMPLVGVQAMSGGESMAWLMSGGLPSPPFGIAIFFPPPHAAATTRAQVIRLMGGS
jgi:hypothetical protein